MTDSLKSMLLRRRALLIAPFAFAGLVAVSSRRASDEEVRDPGDSGEVEIVEFDDAGASKGPARRKRVIRSEAEWRNRLTAEQFYVTRRRNTDTPFTGSYYRRHDTGVYRCIC